MEHVYFAIVVAFVVAAAAAAVVVVSLPTDIITKTDIITQNNQRRPNFNNN